MGKKMITYKGTDQDMKCHGGFQYELGKKYEDDGAIRCGGSGYHSCKVPLDVFQYFAPNKSQYFICEAGGIVDEDNKDSKIASSELILKAEIGIPGLVKAHIDYVKSHTTTEHTDPERATAGDCGAATAGDYGAATAGDYGAATAGRYGAATTGDRGAATTGDRGAATAGDCGAATAGHRGAATAGDYGAATTGDYGAATAGRYGAATTGDYGAATAGRYGAATTGDCGAATSRGSVTVGANGAGLVRSNDVKIRGGLGAILVIAEEKENSYDLTHWKTVVVDGETVKADTWYKLVDGELVEAEQC
ncbi:MAG: hypothetical protein ACLTKB_09180 [Lawsonibacter sp.]